MNFQDRLMLDATNAAMAKLALKMPSASTAGNSGSVAKPSGSPTARAGVPLPTASQSVSKTAPGAVVPPIKAPVAPKAPTAGNQQAPIAPGLQQSNITPVV